MKDKIAIITGASSGIGRSLAVKVSEAGAVAVLVARNENKLNELSAEMTKRGLKSFVVPADVTKAEHIEKLVKTVVEKFGRVDYLFNNAGGCLYGKVAETDMAQARANFELNFFAPVIAIQKIVPIMKKNGGGAIVNISSTAGIRAWPFNGFYCAAKHALNAITESLMMETRNDNIQVLLVMPGTTNTNFVQNSINVPEKTLKNPPQDMTPDQVAVAILNALKKKKKRILLTRKGQILWMLNRISPGIVDKIVEPK